MVPFRSLDAAEVGRLRLSGGVPIPTLDEALESIGANASVYIEVKVPGIEAALSRCLRRHSANVSRYAVHAFDHRIVRRMLELVPSVRTGILQVSYLVDSCAAMRKAGAADLWQHADFIDATLVADIHSCGGRIVAWTANDETAWERLAKTGVDGVCTDRIDSYIAWRASVHGDS
jgi:glycerophosphoryl diester phosphodiesterase